MRVLSENIITNKVTVSATNENDNYQAINIAHPIITRIFQASADNSVITITLDDQYDINCYFIGYHNLNGISVVFKNLAGGTVYTDTPSYNFDVGSYYFTKIRGIKTIEITCKTAETYLRLGQFACGVYYQAQDFLNQYVKAVDDLSSIEQTPSGQSLFNPGANLRAYEIAIPQTIDTGLEDEFQQQFMHLTRPIFIDLTENNRWFIEPGYFTVLEVPGMQRVGRKYSSRLVFREAR